MFALVAIPVVAAAAALYGSGKAVEGIGRGMSAGPQAALRAYRKIKGEAGDKRAEDAQEQQWQQHQQQHQQQYQQQQQQQQHQGDLAEVAPPVEEGSKPRDRSLRMPMKGSLMEDLSIGMSGGSGSRSMKK